MSEDPEIYAAGIEADKEPAEARIRVWTEHGTIWLVSAGDPFVDYEESRFPRCIVMSNVEAQAGKWVRKQALVLLREVQKRWIGAELKP